MSYGPGEVPHVFIAPHSGRYDLYASSTEQAVWSAILLKGDAIGYARAEEGTLVGVADVQRHALEEGSYRWGYVAERPPLPHVPHVPWADVGVSVVKVAAVCAIYSPLFLLGWAAHASQGGGARHR
jgi:hypothetical protein